MKPLPVSGSPVSTSHGAAPASVTQSASSNSIRLPLVQTSAPGSTRTTALPVKTVIRRSPRIRSNRRPTARIMRREEPVTSDEGNLYRGELREAMLRREGEFDPAGAAADDGEAQPRHLPGARSRASQRTAKRRSA